VQVNPFDKRTRGWYTVSVDTLRGLLVLALLAGIAGVGYIAYERWSARELERESGLLLAEVQGLLERALLENPSGAFGEEYAAARRDYGEAAAEAQARDFRSSVAKGRRARALLLAILDAAAARQASGEAQFIAVQGGVEFRRGERGDWEEARSRIVLQAGDYVKTAANGSAEIVFLDGTLYTVRPNTLFLVTRREGAVAGATDQGIRMEYGWVNLNTAQRGGRVETPSAEARVARESEATVAFDRDGGTARYVAYRGSLEVESRASGEVRRVEALQQVSQGERGLSAPRRIPGAPDVVRPPENYETTLDAAKEIVLSWGPVQGATRYALQVSRNRLFVDNLIDVGERAKTEATLGLRAEGTFEWRVAARTADGLQGPWTDPRTFRVLAARSAGERGDKTPPILELDQVQAYGNIFIVSGRTEAGATLRVNGEPVAIAANGTFTKTVQVASEGWTFLELEAADVSGNEARLRHRVFVETL
jgi:hypothetical protein